MTVENQPRTLLAVLVAQSDKTHEEHVAEFNKRAIEMGECATLSLRQFDRWLASELTTLPRPTARRVAEAQWGRPIQELLGPPMGSSRLGLGSHATERDVNSEEDGMERRGILRGALAASGMGLGAPVLATVERLHHASGLDTLVPLAESVASVRRQLDEMLSATLISDSTVDHWRSVADSYSRVYRTSAPMTFLITIVRDISDLRVLADRRLPTAQRRGLCWAVARMAGLLATTLINLNEHREARGWFQTAERAAEESEDVALRAWVMVRHAVSALYWNDPHGALDLATRAGALTIHMPCAATARAPAVQARAYSRLGAEYVEATRAAIGRAEDAYAGVESQPGEQFAYGYTAAQFHFYRSNALTEIGDTKGAYLAQEAALAHYGPTEFLDPSLVRLDRAICLAKDGETEEAARFARHTLTLLPPEHLSPIVLQRARQLASAIPSTQRGLAAVRDFHGTLALEAATP